MKNYQLAHKKTSHEIFGVLRQFRLMDLSLKC